jgi:hypothetical protein
VDHLACEFAERFVHPIAGFSRYRP